MNLLPISPQGSSRQTGGVFRGNASGNAYNLGNSMTERPDLIPAAGRKAGKCLIRVFGAQVDNPMAGGWIFSAKLVKVNKWNDLLKALAVKYPALSSKFHCYSFI